MRDLLTNVGDWLRGKGATEYPYPELPGSMEQKDAPEELRPGFRSMLDFLGGDVDAARRDANVVKPKIPVGAAMGVGLSDDDRRLIFEHTTGIPTKKDKTGNSYVVLTPEQAARFGVKPGGYYLDRPGLTPQTWRTIGAQIGIGIGTGGVGEGAEAANIARPLVQRLLPMAARGAAEGLGFEGTREAAASGLSNSNRVDPEQLAFAAGLGAVARPTVGAIASALGLGRNAPAAAKGIPEDLSDFRNLPSKEMRAAQGRPANPNPAKPIEAYHGSPHKFDEVSDVGIGSGEGAQSYGYGHYYAERKGVANSYRRAHGLRDPGLDVGKIFVDGKELVEPGSERLAKVLGQRRGDLRAALYYLHGNWPEPDLVEARKLALQLWSRGGKVEMADSKGQLYRVNINASSDNMLHWDLPLSKQPKPVQQALAKLGITDPNITGEEIMSRLGTSSPRTAAKLQDAGIDGIRYLDGGSRGRGQGSYNYVIFDPAMVRIVQRYGDEFFKVHGYRPHLLPYKLRLLGDVARAPLTLQYNLIKWLLAGHEDDINLGDRLLTSGVASAGLGAEALVAGTEATIRSGFDKRAGKYPEDARGQAIRYPEAVTNWPELLRMAIGNDRYESAGDQ